MAIVESMWLKNSRKKLGGTVIYQAMGQTRQRELASAVSNPRTSTQMAHRVRWSNCVNFYRVNSSWLKYAYETKKQNQSEYNKFMSLNAANSPIFLSKQEAAAGSCVVAPYIMMQGSLPSIETNKYEDGWLTNLYIGQNTIDISDITIAALTALLLEYNPALREGDQLSFVRFTQQTNVDTGYPFVIVRKYELILNSYDTRLFSEFFPIDYFETSPFAGSAVISIADSGQAGGFIIGLSRTVGGKTYVSTQSIVVANNEAMIEAYSSAAALQRAVDSYGESEEAFLSSTSANKVPLAPVPNSILSIKVGTNTYTPGQQYSNLPNWASTKLEVFFNTPVTGSDASVSVTFYKNGTAVTDTSEATIVNGVVTVASLDSIFDDSTGASLGNIAVTVDGVTYNTVYVVRNEDTIHGLE